MKDLQKLPAVETICTSDQLRPTMNHVLLTREKFVATDAHVMIWHDTEKYFDKSFIENIPEAGLLIHAQDWAKMKKCVFFEWHKGLIKINYAKNRPVIIEPETPENIGKYPNWTAVIPTVPEGGHGLDAVCINPDLLMRAKKAVDMGENNLIMTFTGPNRAILLKEALEDGPGENYVGLIMPCMIKKQY